MERTKEVWGVRMGKSKIDNKMKKKEKIKRKEAEIK